MTKKLDDKGCCVADLDMYSDELYEKKTLPQKTRETIKKIFQKYPELKKDFPKLAKNGRTITGAVTKKLETGVVHDVPSDLKKALTASEKVRALWNGLTPLARNEWICWTTYVKTEETRKEHVKRVCEDLLKGKRRPCCWPGCKHR